MIVHRARGSIRDSLTMLEKCIIGKSVTEKNVEEALHLVNMHFLRETFDACISGDATSISHILETINNEGIDVRQFAAQMTEWIVDNIQEAFEQKMFPMHKEIFDLFTRVFVQSRQVSVPMDILKMALYERVKSGKLEKSSNLTPFLKGDENIAGTEGDLFNNKSSTQPTAGQILQEDASEPIEAIEQSEAKEQPYEPNVMNETNEISLTKLTESN